MKNVDWSLVVAVLSLLVAAVSMLIAVPALRIARKTLDLTEEDWKQKKWFDLYLKSNAVFDSLARFQAEFSNPKMLTESAECKARANDLVFLLRELHAIAMVFPISKIIDDLVEATERLGKSEMLCSTGGVGTIFRCGGGD